MNLCYILKILFINLILNCLSKALFSIFKVYEQPAFKTLNNNT